MSFHAGDFIFHRPSGEEWVLACDEDQGDVICCGWPESYARAADCDLKEAASDAERLRILELAAKSRNDHGGTTRRSRTAHFQLTGERQS